MRGTFGAGIDHMISQIGRGTLRGELIVDQVYAKYQHEHPEFHHPDGGKAFYLRDPLFASIQDFMRHLANKTVTKEGSEIVSGMADNMEKLSLKVYEEAPWEFADLRASGHPRVKDGRKIVYDRAPHVHRLTASELREKSYLRNLLWPGRYKR